MLGSSALMAVIKRTVAAENLRMTDGALLCITSYHVQLPLEDTTILARMNVGTIIVSLSAVGNSGECSAAAEVRGCALGLGDSIWPALDHSDATVLDEARHVIDPDPSLLPNEKRLSCGALLSLSQTEGLHS